MSFASASGRGSLCAATETPWRYVISQGTRITVWFEPPNENKVSSFWILNFVSSYLFRKARFNVYYFTLMQWYSPAVLLFLWFSQNVVTILSHILQLFCCECDLSWLFVFRSPVANIFIVLITVLTGLPWRAWRMCRFQNIYLTVLQSSHCIFQVFHVLYDSVTVSL